MFADILKRDNFISVKKLIRLKFCNKSKGFLGFVICSLINNIIQVYHQEHFEKTPLPKIY